ncbi:predicted protein [Streptomyces viridochromogenes DSM 40736]|uniref:Predicted protein n=1 Tax=Streptomyces viridochromogenes (strain DSM 40736 / JCM 4977 / BCRC 1201 / Tue 494) TaxID=591159 RepID=D9X0B0_STRVT|nr:hypothetical protein [Streptomyces viridochromogenes]EFL35494.1 predicted protein [Streptomyces viridochromogenes DSM 40736]
MTGGMTAVLFILLAVLVTSMSASGEKFRAMILVCVTLLLASTPIMSGVHDALLKMIVSF